MKSNHITLRIDDELRKSLEMTSENTGKKISEIIRDEIEYINTTKTFHAISNKIVSKADYRLFKNLDYPKFISFLYRKKEFPEVEEDVEKFIELSDDLLDNPVLTERLKKDIQYVKEDLIRALNSSNPNFTYSFPYHFDYEEFWVFNQNFCNLHIFFDS